MYRVLIIDDEYLYREALKTTIPWQSLACQVVGEAENGKQGLEKIASLKPDIIIADINMPQMDGLTMVKEMKTLGIDTSIIMLTGFAELDYARTAIKYGVDSFCLKPIDDDEIIGELDRILTKRQATQVSPKSEYKHETGLSKKFVDVSGFMNGLLTQEGVLEDSHVLKHLGAQDLQVKTYRLLMSLQVSTSLEQVDYKQVTVGLLRRYREHLNRDIEIISWSSESNRIDFLCSSDNENNLTKMKLKNFFLKEVTLFKGSYGVEAALGVSKVFTDMAQLIESYNEVNNCLRNCFFDRDQSVVFSRDVMPSLGSLDKDVVEAKLLRIFHEVRARNTEGLKDLLHCLYGILSECQPSKNSVADVGMSLYQIVEDYFNDFTTGEKLQRVYREQFKKDLQYSVHIEEQMAHTIKTVIQIINKVDEKEITEKSKLVSDIKVYVEDHLGESTLDIESISENSNFSYHYVCKVFKKKTGITLGHYILEKRMERAKNLILDGLDSVDVLADRVGYTDTNYFSKAFKKYFDISPSKLMRGLKGGHK